MSYTNIYTTAVIIHFCCT